MIPRGFGNNGANLDQKTIMFCKKAPKTMMKSYVSIRNNSSSHEKLFLLSKYSEFSIFESIPKNFSISTKNFTSHFNLDMLKEASPVITDFVRDNPNTMQYNLNIIDEENVLSKIEQLFLGKTVTFIEDELPTSQRITKILQMKNFPNRLKPESMRIKDIYSDGSFAFSFNKPNEQIQVEIYEDMFIEYLKKTEIQTFTIKTNRKEYKCNIFGIYSSNVIKQILEKNPSINEFEFDFEDEFDEFQSICDFFNFKQVDIKSDNMDLLKEIAENLQINCIIKQIDNYINNYENFSQKIEQKQTIIDSIDNLFDLLCNINNYGIQKVNISIVQSKWSQKVESVQELAAFILQIVKQNYSIHNEIIELLIMLKNEANETNNLDILMPFIIDKLLNLYMTKSVDLKISNSFSFNINQSQISKNNINYYLNNNDGHFIYLFIRNLYNRGIISKEKIIKKLKNNENNENLNAFFLPEMIEINSKNIVELIRLNNDLSYNFVSFINKYLPDKIDLYKRMLNKIEPDDKLTKALRIDDVDTLQSIITSNEIDFWIYYTTFLIIYPKINLF